MLVGTPPGRRGHVAQIEASKVEHDGVALVEQISIGCHHAVVAIDTEALAMGEWLPAEPRVGEINEMVERRPVQDNNLFITLYWTRQRRRYNIVAHGKNLLVHFHQIFTIDR